ncbi:MAG: hypothetical protein M3285_03665 [Actinomycetota bacterium]|nr:hypothetical protein [Actinomycetota bacterium]
MSAFTSLGNENQMVWDRNSTSFMEVWYSTITHRESGCGVWIRYTITSPASGSPYCELWAFVFDPSGRRSFAGKNRFPIDRLGRPRDDGSIVRIGDAWLSETHLDGRVEAGGRSLSWSLDMEPAPQCFQHLPAALRGRIEKRVSTVCSPNLSVPFAGEVYVDQEVLRFDGDHGCQSHRWGRSHSESWTWAHCRFEEQGGVFEGLAAKTRLGPLPAPTTTLIFLKYADEDIAFNEMRWALRAKSNYDFPTWTFTARTDRWKLTGTAELSPVRSVQVTYTDPDGSNRYCCNSEVADMALQLFARDGRTWSLESELVADGDAHLEFGGREPVPGVSVSF